jgi:flagellar export protein FliJ
MKRFSFSLQPVHKLRTAQREAAEGELAKAATELTGATKMLEKVIHERDMAVEAYVAHTNSGAIDVQELSLYVGHIASLVRRENQKREQIKVLEAACDARRFAVMDASRGEKAITNLRDRHHARHVAEAARIEQTNLDEMATMAFVRRCEVN